MSELPWGSAGLNSEHKHTPLGQLHEVPGPEMARVPGVRAWDGDRNTAFLMQTFACGELGRRHEQCELGIYVH
jgi:hypothetical protein